MLKQTEDYEKDISRFFIKITTVVYNSFPQVLRRLKIEFFVHCAVGTQLSLIIVGI